MEQEIIARGKRAGKSNKHKRIIAISVILALVIMAFGLVNSISKAGKAIDSHTHTKYCYRYSYRSDFSKDNKANNLKEYKMDCDYTKNAFELGLSRYFKGGAILPIMILIMGVTTGMASRAQSIGYVILVTDENVLLTYTGGKTTEIPLCSIFMVEKLEPNGLSVVTSENSYKLQHMKGRDEVYDAIKVRMPAINIKGPANNEQVLAKGYPPAIKPWLLVLTVLFALAAVICGIAVENFAIFLVLLLPAVVVFIFYLLAKTPYLVVTDKRVFYVSDFGRKLSLPLNKITVTVTHRWFKQLHIAAAAGRIHLFGVNNTAELYDIIAALINEKQ